MRISLSDIYIAEQKLRIISEKQNVLALTTLWKGKQILMTYNKVMGMLAPLDWIDEGEVDEEDYKELTKIIKKCIRNTWQVRLSDYIIINFNYF